jgi:transposase
MNKAIPKIKETAEEIREMLKDEPHVRKQNRLQALYLIVTGEAKSRTKVAKILGFNRNSISDWFTLYERGGLEKMLEIYKPSGAKPKIPKEAIEEIKQQLATAKGFRTYKEIHELVVNKYGVEVVYSGVHNLVRYRLEAKAKSPRPSNPKKKRIQSENFETESEKSFKR